MRGKMYSPIFVSNKECHVTNWMPETNKKPSNLNTNSWFDAKCYDNPNTIYKNKSLTLDDFAYYCDEARYYNEILPSCGIDMGIY